MSEELKRRRGTPYGNQNARKHGFYSNVIDATEQGYLKSARFVKGLDEEIVLLRAKIKSVARQDPNKSPPDFPGRRIARPSLTHPRASQHYST